MFSNSDIDFTVLKQRAFNLRWASVEEGVIPLTAADPDFPCAPEIIEALQSYLSKPYLSYGPTEGMMEFKEASSQFFYEKRKVQIPPVQILPVDSAAFGIHLVCATFLQAGDEAIIFDPVDFLFRYNIEQVGAKAVSFAIAPGTEKIAIEQLETCITSKTKMICLCNPLNPIGKVFSREELTEIGTLAIKHNLIILSDEIWSDIVFTPTSYCSIASINEEINQYTIIVTGFSKSYGLAGLRIGTIATANNVWYDALFARSLYRSTVHGVNVLSQVAATAALTKCDYWLNAFVAHLHEMRNVCYERVKKIHGWSMTLPDGCYVAFIDIRKSGYESESLQKKLLEEAKVAVVPGLAKWFGDGAAGYIRVCFATSKETLEEAFNRIEKSQHT